MLHCDAAIVLLVLSYMFGNKNLNWQNQTFLGVGHHKGIILRAPKWLAAALMMHLAVADMFFFQLFDVWGAPVIFFNPTDKEMLIINY